MAKAEHCIKFICDNCGQTNFCDNTLSPAIHKCEPVMKDRIDCFSCNRENFVYEKIKDERMTTFTSGDGEKITIEDFKDRERRRVVVCAAIRHKNGGGIICGPRHFDMIMNEQIRNNAYKGWQDADQGFVDQFGKYLSRKDARVIAGKKDQIIKKVGGDAQELYSENLY